MIGAETLGEALDSLGLAIMRQSGAWLQLTFVGLPFGPPVRPREAWALVRLLRAGHPATTHTLDRAIRDAAGGSP